MYQINGPVIPLYHNRTLDRVNVCYTKVMGTVKHEKTTQTLTGGLKILKCCLTAWGGVVPDLIQCDTRGGLVGG